MGIPISYTYTYTNVHISSDLISYLCILYFNMYDALEPGSGSADPYLIALNVHVSVLRARYMLVVMNKDIFVIYRQGRSIV